MPNRTVPSLPSSENNRELNTTAPPIITFCYATPFSLLNQLCRTTTCLTANPESDPNDAYAYDDDPSMLTQPIARSVTPPKCQPPRSVVCHVQTWDCVELSGRSEMFTFGLQTTLSEVYEAVQWWVGEVFIVLFEHEHHQPLATFPLTRVWRCDASVTLEALWQYDRTNNRPMPSSASPSADESLRFDVLCHRSSCPPEQVVEWGVVHTYSCDWMSSHRVAVGLPPVVVPLVTKRTGTSSTLGASSPAAEPPKVVVQDRDVLQRVAFICCASPECSAFMTQRTFEKFTLPPEVMSTALSFSPMELGLDFAAPCLLGYPPIAVGDILRCSLLVRATSTAAHCYDHGGHADDGYADDGSRRRRRRRTEGARATTMDGEEVPEVVTTRMRRVMRLVQVSRVRDSTVFPGLRLFTVVDMVSQQTYHKPVLCSHFGGPPTSVTDMVF